MKRTVLRMLDEAATRWPSAPYAFRKTDAGYKPVSFAEARTQARGFAAWLLSREFHKGDTLAILAEGSPQWIVGELGLLSAGCISVPLSIKLLEEEIPFPLNHSGARAILTTKNQLRKVLGSFRRVDNAGIMLIYLDDDIEHARKEAEGAGVSAERLVGFDEALAAGREALAAIGAELDRASASVEEDDTVTISYTSGTTGNPKGIMLTHLNYWTNCHDAIKAIPLPPGWRSLIILPVDHSFAHTAGLYAALACGISLYFVDSRGGAMGTLRNIPINLGESASHFLFTVPALSGSFMRKIIAGVEEKGGLIEKLFKAGISAGIAFIGNGFNPPPLTRRLAAFFPYALARLVIFGTIRKMVFGPSIKFCIGGGAMLDLKQQQFFAALGAPVYQGYGLTEASPIISANTPSRHKLGTSGAVFESVECRIVKPDGSPAARGEKGEIVIRGASVMKGYFRNPEATASALRDGWLYTGDLAYLDSDGFLVVIGREKALLITEDGEKYSPEEIEEAVSTSTEVIDQVMAYCDHRKYTICLVSLDTGKVERLIKTGGIRTAEALLQALTQEFTRYRTDPRAKKVQPTWVPSVFQIVPGGFSDKDGTVNSNMKIVRRKIVEVHKDLVEYSYCPEGSRTGNPRNLQAVRTLFALA